MYSGTLGARQELHQPLPPVGTGNGRAPASIRDAGERGAGQDPAKFRQGLGLIV